MLLGGGFRKHRCLTQIRMDWWLLFLLTSKVVKASPGARSCPWCCRGESGAASGAVPAPASVHQTQGQGEPGVRLARGQGVKQSEFSAGWWLPGLVTQGTSRWQALGKDDGSGSLPMGETDSSDLTAAGGPGCSSCVYAYTVAVPCDQWTPACLGLSTETGRAGRAEGPQSLHVGGMSQLPRLLASFPSHTVPSRKRAG